MQRLALLLVVPLAACGAADPARDEPLAPPGRTVPIDTLPHFVLPENWLWIDDAAFEELALTEFADGTTRPIHHESLARLFETLSGRTADAVRAAVLLGRSRDNRAGELLLRRLEQRIVFEERADDAGDFVAAAALATFPRPERYTRRLTALAAGPRPHPDLEVRVQCGASAVDLGDDGAVSFLLAVLRIDTREGLLVWRDFDVAQGTAWARATAAECLARRAGMPNPYRIDASVDDRAAAAAELSEVLRPVWAPPPPDTE